MIYIYNIYFFKKRYNIYTYIVYRSFSRPMGTYTYPYPTCIPKKDLHLGGQTSDLVELIIRRVNGAAQPDPLIAELERFGFGAPILAADFFPRYFFWGEKMVGWGDDDKLCWDPGVNVIFSYMLP